MVLAIPPSACKTVNKYLQWKASFLTDSHGAKIDPSAVCTHVFEKIFAHVTPVLLMNLSRLNEE